MDGILSRIITEMGNTAQKAPQVPRTLQSSIVRTNVSNSEPSSVVLSPSGDLSRVGDYYSKGTNDTKLVIGETNQITSSPDLLTDKIRRLNVETSDGSAKLSKVSGDTSMITDDLPSSVERSVLGETGGGLLNSLLDSVGTISPMINDAVKGVEKLHLAANSTLESLSVNPFDEKSLAKNYSEVARAASSILGATNKTIDDLRYAFNTVSTLGAFSNKTLWNNSGIDKVLGAISNELTQWNSANPLYLVNNALQRFFIQRVLTNTNLTGTFTGYGFVKNQSGVVFNNVVDIPGMDDTAVFTDYTSYRSVQNLYEGLINSSLTDDNKASNYIKYPVQKPIDKVTESIFDRDTSTIHANPYLVGYDTSLWDFSIYSYTHNDKLSHPFPTFFPALSINFSDVSVSNSLGINLPLGRSINLPGQKELPKSLSVSVMENRYLLVDRWLRNIVNTTYQSDNKGGYKLLRYKDASFVLEIALLNPQLKTVESFKYYAIPEIDFNYSGSETSSLKEVQLNFNIIGSDTY